MPSGLPTAWRLIMALVAGLLFGLLASLLGSLNWSGPLNLLFFSPLLLLGMIGRLIAGPRAKRPELVGLGIGELSWFGIWFSALAWQSFQPQTVYDCFHGDPPCPPATVSFWGEYLWITLFAYCFLLAIGLVLVLVGLVITSIALDTIRQRGSKSEVGD